MSETSKQNTVLSKRFSCSARTHTHRVLQAILTAQQRCNLINRLPTFKPGIVKNYTISTFIHWLTTYSISLQLLQPINDTKVHFLPLKGEAVCSAGNGSLSFSLATLGMFSFPSNLSTIAIMQFKLFPTLVHTLSWKREASTSLLTQY